MAKSSTDGGRNRSRNVPVVGIGASAGGLAAFKPLLRHLPSDSGIAWVLVQHMAPNQESYLPQILAQETSMPVMQADDAEEVRPDHVYVIPPGRVMTIRMGRLELTADGDHERRSSIDTFFISLATDVGENCGCALLSGAGTDGTIGLAAVKEAGGITLAQLVSTAEYDSMLLSAIRTGLVDQELPVEQMGAAFEMFLVKHRSADTVAEIGDNERERAYRVLLTQTGYDFSGYKNTTVDRRLRRRIQMLGSATPDAYLHELESRENEGQELFRDLLIGVTQFFRDPDAFAYLAENVVPRILENKTEDDEIRVWVPGCASGEEAYSLAMLFREAMSAMDSVPTLKIFGSDIDDAALHTARGGCYPHGIEGDVSAERLKRFFNKDDGTYLVRGALRETCLFARHNVLRDPPFSRIDLISCRNLLIYLDSDLQRRLNPVFHYALRRGGYLFLGPAEGIPDGSPLFAPVERKYRVFQRIGDVGELPEFPLAAGNGHRRAQRSPSGAATSAGLRWPTHAGQHVLNEYGPSYVVVNRELDILEASRHTSAYLELPQEAPQINLASLARGRLATEVNRLVAKVIETGKREALDDLSLHDEAGRRINLIVDPLSHVEDEIRRFLIVFQEIPRPPDVEHRQVAEPDEDLAHILERELVDTREQLHRTTKELETSNVQLKTSNEELSSVNEELQSSNEELETSKEELQSINEELRSVNNELNSRVEDLGRANSDLKNLFANARLATLFLDQQLCIMNFTPPAKSLFYLRDHDIGRPLQELSGRIDYAIVKQEVEAAVESNQFREREIQSRNGEKETFIMRVVPYRDEQEAVRGTVLTFIDISERKRHEEHMALMVAELNHRVKNTVATIQAMASSTGKNAGTVADFIVEFRNRLQALSLAHGLLTEASWQDVDLEELATQILRPHAGDKEWHLRISGPAVNLNSGMAVSLAMILNELASNSVKHGAWSRSEGTVALTWQTTDQDDRRLDIGWEESNGPPVSEPTHTGFGMGFIRQCVDYELHGTCRLEFPEAGLRCLLSIPSGSRSWQRAGETTG